MTEEDKLDETSNEADVAPAPEESVAPERKAGRAGGGIAWLALLIALIAVAGAGYGFVQDWRKSKNADESSRSINDLAGKLDASRKSVTDLGEQVSQLESSGAGIDSTLDALQQDIDNRVRLFESLPARMSNIEDSIASLQGLSTGARNTLLLAEAEYYMQIANAQLQLAGNPDLAALALGMADDRIVQLADPALTEVRGALSDELALLEGMEKPDVEGVTLTLASLSRVVETLPLKRMQELEADDSTVDPEASSASRAWSSVKGAFAGLVKVRKTDDTGQALLAPDAEYFLRSNLALQMQAARLALLRGERSIFEQSLDDADAWIERYFDLEDAQVVSARQTIAEIRGGLFAIEPPDISESLRLLRQHNALAGTAQ
jgi:uncharacterized protein HemX